jgi:porin
MGAAVTLLAAGEARANNKAFLPGFTGDWAGTRTDLQNQGWQFQIRGIAESAYDPVGEPAQAAAGAGEIDFGVLADLGEVIGDDGGSLEAKITDRFGANLVKVAGLNTLMQVQEIWGRGDIWRLTQLSFAQDLFGKLLNIELGRLNPGGDFDVFACNFQNLTFCGAEPGNIDGDYWYNFPVSQWGARLQANLTKTIDAEGGIYQVNSENLKRGFTFDFSSNKGLLFPFKGEWKPEFFGLPGDYQIGGWYSTVNAPDVFYDVNYQPAAVTGSQPLLDHGRSGFFFSVRQQATGDPPPKDAPVGTNGHGLTAFLSYTHSDHSTSMMDMQFRVGATYKGAIPDRPDDELGLAFGTTHINGRLATGEALHDAVALPPFMPVQHTEYATELDYRIILVPGADLSPNVQYVADPGGVGSRDNIVVLGLRAALTM